MTRRMMILERLVAKRRGLVVVKWRRRLVLVRMARVTMMILMLRRRKAKVWEL